jgi:CubicO group peptidase (beta-lactamase class C family)
MRLNQIPDWVTFPDQEWTSISPSDAGLDELKFEEFLKKLRIKGMNYGGNLHKSNDWGLVLTRGGYLLHTWGDGCYEYQTASTGKAFTYAALGLAVQEGLVQADDLIKDTWTGEDQLSHSHKYLDRGYHNSLTWRHLVGIKWEGGHYGGFPIEIGYFWKLGRDAPPPPGFGGMGFGGTVPDWANWTGDPFYDNYSHIEPGSRRHYSSAGTWRVAQALTYLWGRDLKDVLDEKIMQKIGIAPDDWEWMVGRDVQQDKDFYPDMPDSWGYLDPPYEINGHPVRSGPGWVVMSAKNLARYGLLVATGGNWKGEQLIAPGWVRTHSGGNGSGLHGENRHYTSMGRVAVEGINMRFSVDRESFIPQDIFQGPVKLSRMI